MNYKERLFAQYWGQRVVKFKGNDVEILREWTFGHPTNIEESHLLLTPLSMITDEHAIECVRMRYNGFLNVSITEKRSVVFKFEFEYETSKMRRTEFINVTKCQTKIYDYLRKHGYALEFDGKSVEDQVKDGDIKLKEQ